MTKYEICHFNRNHPIRSVASSCSFCGILISEQCPSRWRFLA